MPRQPRYFVPDVPQHVIQRGVDRQPVFFDGNDYSLYLHALGNAAVKYECQIHAYVLMTNHTHLLVTPKNDQSIPLLMQAIGRSYVQKLNRIHNRTGTLWEGRYKACLIQYDRYLLACHRYIELNPVRAGMVSSPAAFPHSSYRHNALGEFNPILSEHAMYRALAKSAKARQMAYRCLFSDAISPKMIKRIRDTTNACLVLGNNRFKNDIERMLGRSVRPKKPGRPKSIGKTGKSKNHGSTPIK